MNSDATCQPLPIFVYGTLMIGQPNDYMWQDSIHSFEAAFASGYSLYDFGYYPVMIAMPGNKVVGQLVHLEKDRFSQIIKNLDFLEGLAPDHPQESEFRRVQIQVSTITGHRVEAWTYVGNEVHVRALPVVNCGDWVEHAVGGGDYFAALLEENGIALRGKRPPSDDLR